MTGREDHLSNQQHGVFAGRYRIGPVIGRGGLADVVHATDERLGRSVAIKIFRPGEHGLADARRVEAEMKTLASLSHPGLVTLFDAGTAPDAMGADAPFLVMEFVDGPTLGAFRSGGSMEPAEVAHIGCGVADALAYIHSVGVVHRDVKPANILMTRPAGAGVWSTKLADFGIARVVDADRLTEHGNTVGTAHYLSPEQAIGSTTGPPADIYSLGLVLIECLTGRMVFEGSGVAAAVARLHRDPEVPAGLGREWTALLSEMTSRSPEDRPTATSVANRLRGLSELPAGAATIADTRALPTSVIGTSRSRRTVGAWAAGAALVVAACAAGAAIWTSSATDENRTPSIDTISVPATAPAGSPSAVVPPAVEAPASEPSAEQEPPQVAPAQVVPQAPVVTVPENPNSSGGNGNNGNGNGNNGNGNSEKDKKDK